MAATEDDISQIYGLGPHIARAVTASAPIAR